MPYANPETEQIRQAKREIVRTLNQRSKGQPIIHFTGEDFALFAATFQSFVLSPQTTTRLSQDSGVIATVELSWLKRPSEMPFSVQRLGRIIENVSSQIENAPQRQGVIWLKK